MRYDNIDEVTYNTILNVCRDVRENIQQELGESDVTGTCAICSNRIQKILSEDFNIECIIIKGAFATDLDELPHFWIEYDGYIIDVTADQFNYDLSCPMEEIVIKKLDLLDEIYTPDREDVKVSTGEWCVGNLDEIKRRRGIWEVTL